ncbi:LysR substrate-binding domain-containing protein [Pseudonocardia endophytica]|uniref:LysR family transcriptional regulator n=1 Tax=Pseudonocardia endophytica TaxID=401976 RepID=A0A4R1HXR7_PSEEN|nr:LysR substrate-binding domain-containing protein [Pseudonocardia endophytica]TCK27594.1 LysR family transcriptional regulator [Pseudonocardia endophytica]
MELRHLRYFVAVAEELHFGRAAEKLHMAQSPLSRQIQGLERELRTPLLRRTTRQVSLTAAGAELLERGRKLLAHADEVVEVVRDVGRDASPVRIGFTACAANAVLGQVVQIARDAMGDLSADVRTDLLTPTQLHAVSGGSIDIGFVVMPSTPVPEELGIASVRIERLAVVLPDGHRLADVKQVNLIDLADEELVMFARSTGSVVRAVLDQACARAGFTPQVVHQARDTGTVLGLVAAGLGCTVLPLSVREGAASGVLVRPLADPIEIEIGMVWRREETRRDVARVVAALRRDVASAGDGQSPPAAGGTPRRAASALSRSE